MGRGCSLTWVKGKRVAYCVLRDGRGRRLRARVVKSIRAGESIRVPVEAPSVQGLCRRPTSSREAPNIKFQSYSMGFPKPDAG